MDMPIRAETAVQRTGVKGKPISKEFETTWEEVENTEGKLQGREGCDMHGTTQVHQHLMCNTMAHHACSAAIPAN